MKKRISFIVILSTLLLLGLPASNAVAKKQQREILYWVAPMDPNYRRDAPGKSPMGMDLVPVYADEQASDEGVIKISPVVENNLGVKISEVKSEKIARIIDTVGYVTVDENKITHIHTYTDGWIKVLTVKTTGEVVKQGQLLFELYSPTLINAQEEFLLALKNDNATLIRAGERKLSTLGLNKKQINKIRQSKKVMQRVKFYAPQAGIIAELNVREGVFVKPGKAIMSVEDLSSIWMIAEVFERQANWVKVGQAAIAKLAYMPGKTWQGKVEYVYPELDEKTRTLKIRLTFPNPDLTIKPNMYAEIKIFNQSTAAALTIPRSAVIRSGEGDRVILALGDGRYKAQAVKVGLETSNRYAILGGLKLGDKVVTSAQFLIDSESNLKASFSRMSNHKQISAAPQEFIGMGKVNAIDVEKRLLSFSHQPIPELAMPAMTMQLPVATNIDLTTVAVGDEIHFVLIRQADNQYLITKIHVMKK